MRFRVCCFVALLLSPVSAFADAHDQNAALIQAIEDAGCVVDTENGDAVLAASGLSEEEVFAAVQSLYEAGLAVLEPDGSMTLQTDACLQAETN
ncbi:hypothetical protein BVC71_12290 [Marivivens niveibacter]|uniref:Uncharacterized protein n=1 Tax=Marivivens niveibacter TaxID=1930667 RepID=A0A251WXL7_9RHOB|nr:hypothetical protein [Marivivens niveibacter]OUD08703.1 hypothetical protein BVC71_12290 [Marivivens niveibacter]